MSQLEIFDLLEKSSPKEFEESLLKHEVELWKSGFTRIAGVDEVGRGPLAGPVVACACILPKGVVFHGIKDSKALDPNERKRLADFLTNHKDVHFSVGVISSEKIDEINILQATLLAMKEALDTLDVEPDFILVDGRDLPPTSIAKCAVIKGDMVSQSIAAASIIAKVLRDELMDEYHRQYPEYGFDKHKGYGTELHRQAIEAHGACPIHRKTFGQVKLQETPQLFQIFLICSNAQL